MLHQATSQLSLLLNFCRAGPSLWASAGTACIAFFVCPLLVLYGSLFHPVARWIDRYHLQWPQFETLHLIIAMPRIVYRETLGPTEFLSIAVGFPCCLCLSLASSAGICGPARKGSNRWRSPGEARRGGLTRVFRIRRVELFLIGSIWSHDTRGWNIGQRIGSRQSSELRDSPVLRRDFAHDLPLSGTRDIVGKSNTVQIGYSGCPTANAAWNQRWLGAHTNASYPLPKERHNAVFGPCR